MHLRCLKLLGLICSAQLALSAKYSEYILAPTSRTVVPTSIYKVNGTVVGADTLAPTGNGSAVISGGSSITFDFGKNIAGLASITVGNGSTSALGLTYSESSLWISGEGSDAMADAGLDAIYWLDISGGAGTYTVDEDHERGGFKYMSIVYNGTSPVEVTGVSVHFTAVPHIENMANYTGYFHSNDEKVNRVWYAGAYTNQLCTIDPKHGNSLIWLGEINSTSNVSLTDTVPWYLNYTISNGSSVLVDGAKRDRLVWPGDMSIAVPSMLVSTNDLVTIKDSLDSLLILQKENGQLPYAGNPFSAGLEKATGSPVLSFTYHLYSLIGIADYYLYSGDLQYVLDNWDKFTLGLNYSLSQIDDSNLMNVTTSNDWLRFGMGGHNIEANAILYYTINQGIILANTLNHTDLASSWATTAEQIKQAANSLLWNDEVGFYRDNETTTLNPQDGNVWAIKANLTQNATQISKISSNLRQRWTPYGAPALEAADAISPFISSFELEAHFLASAPSSALDLIRLMWADFMLDDPRMTNSTFIEGYASDGTLHYAPYNNDARVSHAHGWATGPTYVLSFYAAGIQLIGANGESWLMKPQPGDLTSVEAGFETLLGAFDSTVRVDKPNGTITEFNFSTPGGTKGAVELPYPAQDGTVTITGPGGNSSNIEVKASQTGTWRTDGLAGGNYSITFTPKNGSPIATGGACRVTAPPLMTAATASVILTAGLFFYFMHSSSN